ncbi:MAG: winged helix-turn-helix domain-containing protein [Desulfocucumaceae bacterium]
MAMPPGFRPAVKIWLEKEGQALGEGLYKLLSLIEKKGSIAGAASEMEMSYRNAWGKIKTAEKAWGIKLVDTRVGGLLGGGTGLTGEAAELIKTYQELRAHIERSAGNFKEGL